MNIVFRTFCLVVFLVWSVTSFARGGSDDEIENEVQPQKKSRVEKTTEYVPNPFFAFRHREIQPGTDPQIDAISLQLSYAIEKYDPILLGNLKGKMLILGLKLSDFVNSEGQDAELITLYFDQCISPEFQVRLVPFPWLPAEINSMIFNYLDLNTAAQAKHVCRDWNTFINNIGIGTRTIVDVGSMIEGVQWSPKGNFVIIHFRHLSRIIKVPQLKEVGRLERLTDPLLAKFSPGEKYIAVSKKRGTVEVLSYRKGRKNFSLKVKESFSFEGSFNSIEFSPRDRYLIVGNGDTAKLLELPNGKKVGDLHGNNFSFSSDEKKIISSKSPDELVRIYQVQEDSDGISIEEVSTLPGKSHVASLDGNDLVIHQDETLSALHHLPSSKTKSAWIYGKDPKFSLNGKYLLPWSQESEIPVKDLESGNTIRLLEGISAEFSFQGDLVLADQGNKTETHPGTSLVYQAPFSEDPISFPGSAARFSPSGKFIIANSKRSRTHFANGPGMEMVLFRTVFDPMGKLKEVKKVAKIYGNFCGFSPDETYVYSWNKSELTMWKIQ